MMELQSRLRSHLLPLKKSLQPWRLFDESFIYSFIALQLTQE